MCTIRDFSHLGIRLSLAGLLLLLLGAGGLHAEPTMLDIHVRANDAKFIGSGVGELNIVIEDAVTGELLDSGRVSGATGDTAALMTEGQTRGRSPVTGAAGYTAALDIRVPTRVRIEVPHSRVRPLGGRRLRGGGYPLSGRKPRCPRTAGILGKSQSFQR